MKKILAWILCALLLAGCSQPAAPTEPPMPTNPPATATEPAVTEPAVIETEAPTDPVMLKFSVYYPNENLDGFDVMTISAATIDADAVIYGLIWAKVLPEGTKVNSMTSEGMQLNIDFNDSFREYLCSMGTTGEYMLMGSVVNTFLAAFEAESAMITVNGEIIESGHVVYDFPLEFME